MTNLVKFNLTPNNMNDLIKFSELIANSDLAPKDYKGKPGNVMIAIQMGVEVGLQPMQAIQNIAVINGRPSVWGDALLALVKVHPHFLSIKEWMEGDIKNENAIAYCEFNRKGEPPVLRSFSVSQAKKAGLWGKQGPWQNYPERMLQMRARGFAIRDAFPDALKGLHVAEEAQDMPPVHVDVVNTPTNDLNRLTAPPTPTIEQPSLQDRAEKAIKYFVDHGSNEATIFSHLNINDIGEITIQHLEELSNIKNLIKQKELTFLNAFTGETNSPSVDELNAMSNTN